MSEIDPAERPDIYIGLVCAAGTDLTEVKAQFEAQLSVVGYRKIDVKASKIIGQMVDIGEFKNEFDRMKAYMEAGDRIRKSSENNTGVANIIISHLRNIKSSDNDIPKSRAFVIDSLKNPAEVELLDKVYGRNYYTISVYCPRDERLGNLRNKIASDLLVPPTNEHEEQAEELIRLDEKGASKSDQNVQDTFPLADFFINVKMDVKNQITRFVELVFGQPFLTPTADEYFMFIAKATALRSCDLSRQVGAVIVDSHNSVLAYGCNEVPLPGGGFFIEGMGKDSDNRDYIEQMDPNYIEIHRSLIEFIGVLKKSGFIDESEKDTDIIHKLLNGEYKELMSNARVRNLIEFGRVVHAEMHAISQAAAVGRAIKNARMYCTTFPCHGCARHIISSGIREVIYIEPYPKSLTLQLYSKEIEVTHSPNESRIEATATNQPVLFRAFHGISPNLYQRVFKQRDRKDSSGYIVKWNPKVALPVGATFGVDRPKIEMAASMAVEEIYRSLTDASRGEKTEQVDAGE